MSRTAKDVFLDALDIADPTERAAYVEREAAADAPLRAAVIALLAAHAGSPTFSPPVVEPSIIGTRPHGSRRSLADAKEGDVVDGQFTLVRRLGEGGFGIVWLARQTEPVTRDVALKLLRGGLDSGQVVARFEAERQTLARMDHPHIARVYDAGTTEDGLPYFAMEYVDGRPITLYCEEENLSLSQRLDLMRQVCLAVQHAHQKGVIHRDLKPGNILVATIDGQPVPKVIDFGIAKAVADDDEASAQPNLTLEAQVIGTPQYMSPEQATIGPKNVDTRSDVYSLGTVLYEIITGSPPFDPQELRRAGLEQICRIVRERTPSKPSTRLSEAMTAISVSVTAVRTVDTSRLRRQVAGEVDWIVMKAIEKEPARRYQTAESLAADISRYLNHEPVEAGPPSRSYALRKFVRRRRLEVAMAAIIALSLVAVAAVSTYQKQQARRAEKIAETARAEAEIAAEGERQAKESAQQSEQIALKRAADAARELSKANAIADFAETMLGALGPGTAQGRDTTLVKEMLAKAADDADKRIINDPELKLMVSGLIGQAHYDLGDYRKAIDVLKPLWDSSRETSSRDSHDRLLIGLQLGTMYDETSQWPQAAEVFREIVASYERLNDTSSNLALQSQSALAQVLSREKKDDEAIALFRKTLDRLHELGRGDTEPAFQVWNGLAVALLHVDKAAEARAEWEALLAAELKKFGEDHPSSIATMTNLATMHGNAGEDEKALEYSQRVVAAGRKIFEPTHPVRVTGLVNLVTALTKAKRFDDAEILVTEGLELAESNPGALGWSRKAFLHNVAMKLDAAKGNLVGAIDHATAMRDIYAGEFPARDWHTLVGQTILIEALLDAKRIDDVQAMFKELGPDPWPEDSPKDYRQAWHAALAQLALSTGHVEEASRQVELGKTLAEKRGDGLIMTRKLQVAMDAVKTRLATTQPATTTAPAAITP